MTEQPVPRGPIPRVGVDVQQVDAVAEALVSLGQRYLDRLHTPAEQADVAGPDADRGAASSTTLAHEYAGRFAGKEAVLKLLGAPDGVDPRDVEVVRSKEGRPRVRLSGHAAEQARALGLGPVDLSISHDGNLAVAVAVALSVGWREEPDER